MAPVQKPKHPRARHFLTEWRDYRGKTQDEVAEYLDTTQPSVSRVENGVTPYDQDLLERLAILYGCEPQDLISVNPQSPDPPLLVYQALRRAPKEAQARAAAIIDALLKTG